MTLASTERAAARVPRAPLWGVARYESAGQPVFFEVSWADLDRDAAWAAGLLSEYGIREDTYVVVVSSTPLAPWLHPFEIAIRQRQGVICPADAYSFDARRTAMFARGTPAPTMVLNLEEQVTTGLSQLSGGIAGTIGNVPFVLARPSVHETLRAAGLEPYGFLPVGPATAVECRARGGLHVNPREWQLEVIHGEVHVSTVGPRAHRVQREPCGIHGSVVTQACRCGRRDPRILLESCCTTWADGARFSA